MARALEVDPVKLVVAALHADSEALASAIEKLRQFWGDVDFEGDDQAFDVTPYYETEMGARLDRRLITFRRLVSPDELVEAKIRTNAVEDELAGPNGRLVNLDVGYLDHHKFVLASVKPAGQKIYLGRGVYADIMLRYHKGRLTRFEWTFPDFRDGRYDRELLDIRARYLAQLRGGDAEDENCPSEG
jgi:hypothetical protein